MIKNSFLLAILIFSFQVFSQEVYLNTGINYTKYNFKSSLMKNDSNFHIGAGHFYEIGITKPFINKRVLYSIGISLNDYNSFKGDNANSYRWETQNLGLNGKISFSLFPKSKATDLLLNYGIIGSTIIYGKQEINGAYYDLVKQKEFSGLWLGNSLGVLVKHHIKSFGSLSLGYNFCQNLNVSNSTKEKITYDTQQVQLGFNFLIN